MMPSPLRSGEPSEYSTELELFMTDKSYSANKEEMSEKLTVPFPLV